MTQEEQEEVKLLKELIADKSISADEREIYEDALNQLMKSEKPKATTSTSKPTTQRKTRTAPTKKVAPAKGKKSVDDVEKAKAEIKAKTGKTEAECESIIEQYRALRTKAQEGKRKAEQASADNKERVDKLERKGDIIAGTNEKTADAVIESTAKDVADKIEKEVEAIEAKAEKEAKAEVAKDNSIKNAKDKKEAIDAIVDEKVKANTKPIVKRIVIDTSALLTSIATSLGKFDKDSQKEFLIKLRSDIDKLLSKYAFGGLTDGGVQVMNVQQSNLSSSSVNPSHFGNGGGVYSSDELYIVKVFDLNGNLLDSSKRVWARNLSKAKEMAIDDFEYDMQHKYGKDLRFRVEEAPSMFVSGGGVGKKKVFEAQEDGILGIYSGSDAYSIEISKGDRFATFGKQDDGNWWFVKKINVKPISLMLENTFDYNQSKSNVPLEIWQDLVLTFPKGDKSIYAEMKEVFANGGGVGDIEEGDMVFVPSEDRKAEVLNIGKSGVTVMYAHSKERATLGLNEIEKLNQYANGGGVGEYNKSWHQDHYRHNKGESYEVPVGSRKHKYSVGGTLLSGMVGAYVGYQYGKKGKKAFKFEDGGMVGQEIVFDYQGEEKTGVIKDVHNSGDYIVNTDDGRTLLAQRDRDVISLGGMRKKASMDAPRKRFGFFGEGGGVDNYESKLLSDVDEDWVNIINKILQNPIFNNYKKIDTFYSEYDALFTLIQLANNHIVIISWDGMGLTYSYDAHNSLSSYKKGRYDEEEDEDIDFETIEDDAPNSQERKMYIDNDTSEDELDEFFSNVPQYANNSKMAKGGLTEHGLMEGDEIKKDFSNVRPNVISVMNDKKVYFVDLDKGERYEDGGKITEREGAGLWSVKIDYYDSNAKADRMGIKSTYSSKSFKVNAKSRDEAYKKATELYYSVKANNNRTIERINGFLLKPNK